MSGALTFGNGCASPTTGRLASFRVGFSDFLLNNLSESLSERRTFTFVVFAFAFSSTAVSWLIRVIFVARELADRSLLEPVGAGPRAKVVFQLLAFSKSGFYERLDGATHPASTQCSS